MRRRPFSTLAPFSGVKKTVPKLTKNKIYSYNNSTVHNTLTHRRYVESMNHVVLSSMGCTMKGMDDSPIPTAIHFLVIGFIFVNLFRPIEEYVHNLEHYLCGLVHYMLHHKNTITGWAMVSLRLRFLGRAM